MQPDVVFLNHGSFGACPRPVFDVYQAWQLELERQPVQFFQRRYRALLGNARQALGRYVGADGDDLLFVPNVMTGLNMVARSLPLEPGDEVLATDLEYGHINATWEYVCRKRGARYVRRPLRLPATTVDEVVEALWSGVTGRTRVLFLSHVTSGTALILPVTELVRRAREAGILTIVDGAQAPGQVDLDLREMGVDFYAGNCHKWMMAPKGSAFVYARPEVQDVLEPLVVVSPPGEAEHPLDRFGWAGTRDISAYLSVPAAIDFAGEFDWPLVRERCHRLVCQARRRIGAITGLPPLSPETSVWFSQMSAIPLPPCDHTLVERLYSDYSIEIPMTGWNQRQFLRLSVQGYNTQADIDKLVEALATLLPEPAEVG